MRLHCDEEECADHICAPAQELHAVFVFALALAHPSTSEATAFQFPCPKVLWRGRFLIDEDGIYILHNEEWSRLDACPFNPPHPIFIDLVAPT